MFDWFRAFLFGGIVTSENPYVGDIRLDNIPSLPIINRIIAPDGFNRSAVLAGGVHPGPVIYGNKGDRFRIEVVNELTDKTMDRATSIHWHGILQDHSSAWADGVSFVTQCPIVPEESFVYDFRVQNQAGTFWYHSHDSTQYCDGLRGPFIVYDPKDPYKTLYDVDNESTIITLADWYHSPAPTFKDQAPPISNSTLINGRGRYPGGPKTPLSLVNVKHGKRYRLRIISMSCYPDFTFSIDGHTLTIIEADGEATKHHTVDSIQIFAGQRYSAILRATQPVGNYWIRSEPGVLRGPRGFDGGINSAILRYAGAPDQDPTSSPHPSPKRLREHNLRPRVSPTAPGEPYLGGADVSISLFHHFDFVHAKYMLNKVSWVNPPTPVLLQMMSGKHTPQELLPSGAVYTLPRNKVIELSLPGVGEGMHPFHLHGHSFSVVRSAGTDEYNYANPMRRDTVNVGVGQMGDNVTIRFVTDNSGPWFLHCHIDWHLELGLAAVFAEDPEGVKEKHSPPRTYSRLRDDYEAYDFPAAWNELCPQYEKFIAGS